MKLKFKIQITFGVCLLLILVSTVTIITVTNYKSTMDIVDQSEGTSAKLSAELISAKFQDLEKVVSFAGVDETLWGKKADTAAKKEFVDMLAQSYNCESANVLDINGTSIFDGTEFADREYVQKALKGEVCASDVTVSRLTGRNGISIAAPIMDDKNIIKGVVYLRSSTDFVADITENINVSENSYTYVVSKDGTIIVHPNTDLMLTCNITEGDTDLGEEGKKIVSEDEGFCEYKYKGEKLLCGYCTIPNTDGWKVVVVAPQSDYSYIVKDSALKLVLFSLIGLAITIVIAFIMSSKICKPIDYATTALKAIEQGNLDVEIPRVGRADEAGNLQNMTGDLMKSLKGIIGDVNKTLESIAQYNLCVEDIKDYPGEFNTMVSNVNSIKATLTDLISEIQRAAITVDTGSKELSQATAAMSEGTLAQANSIQSLAEDLGTVVDVINRNSEREETVNEKLGNLDNQIKNMNNKMSELMNAVNDVETLSASIKKIVGTIDGIAFQTNILSLNASVEAARAGDMGSGFAVVADEVRNLAVQCGESSNKTAELIGNCIDAINHAKKCADDTFSNLSSIVSESAEIASAFEGISKDTVSQAEKSKMIQKEINNISDVVQTNTATAEETAAATEDLANQAANLGDMVKNFVV